MSKAYKTIKHNCTNEGLLLKDSDIEKLYDLTLAIFEVLQDRYDVHAPEHLNLLYEAEGIILLFYSI